MSLSADQDMAKHAFGDFRTANYPKLDEDSAFELYATHLVTQSQGISTEVVKRSIVGATNDGGIDGFLILLNKSEFVGSDSIRLTTRKGNLDGLQKRVPLDIVVVQAKNSLKWDSEALPKLAWFEYLSGNTDRSVNLLDRAAKHQQGQAKALSLYYRGAILNRLGRYEQALTSLDQALAERSDLILAREEKGEALWHLGRRQEAVSAWGDAVLRSPGLPVANNLLAGAAVFMENSEAAAVYEKQAGPSTPADPYYHWMLGLRLQNVGMNELAEKHFRQATELNPAFHLRRNLTPRERR